MRRETWHLTCKKKRFINLKEYEVEIIVAVEKFGGINVIVYEKSFSFEWDARKPMTKGQRAELGRRLAKISGLGCYVDEYHYTRKSSGRRTVSRQLFRVA